MDFQITDALIEGRVKFAESIFIKRFEGTDYEQTFEIVGAAFELSHPAYEPQGEDEGPYFTIHELGYRLTQKGLRPKGKQATTLNIMDRAVLDDLGERIKAQLAEAGS